MAEFDRRPGPNAGSEGSEGHVDPAPRPQPIIDELRLLIAATRQMASAEAAYQSARARLMVKAAAWIAGGAAAALALSFFVAMALVMGLLLALAPLLGRWGALGAIFGGLVLLALVAALVVFSGVRRFIALMRDGRDRS